MCKHLPRTQKPSGIHTTRLANAYWADREGALNPLVFCFDYISPIQIHMTIKSNREMCICTTDVRDINNKEMRQMHELNNRIEDVLASHKPESKEKKYINDDDLKLMHAILSVFTKEYKNTQTSAFDDFLKEQDKPAEEPKQEEDKPEVAI